MSIKLSMLENSQNYIYRAMQDLTEGVDNDNILQFKYSIIHIFAGIELLMKERLQLEHWTLLFDKVDEASILKLTSGDFKGPSIDKIIDRLKNIVRVDERHLNLEDLNELKKIRNKIQHFAIDINSSLAKQIIAKGLNIYLSFYRNCFSDYDEDYVSELYLEATTYQEFTNVRLRDLHPILSSSIRPLNKHFKECAICGNDSIVIDELENSYKCLLCENSYNIDNYLSSESEVGEIEKCPNCKRRSLVFILFNNEEGAEICGFCDYIKNFPEEAT